MHNKSYMKIGSLVRVKGFDMIGQHFEEGVGYVKRIEIFKPTGKCEQLESVKFDVGILFGEVLITVAMEDGTQRLAHSEDVTVIGKAKTK